MDAHLKDKDIDRLVSGIMSRKETLRAETHLKECDLCRQRVSVLSGILKEQRNDSVPGDHVKDSILSEWHKMDSGITVKHGKPAFTLRFAYGFAAAVFIAVSVYFTITRIPHSVYEDGLSAASITGEVLVNNTTANNNDAVKKGDLITTGLNSSVSLTTGNYRLKIEDSSELVLAESGSETGFVFNLNRGSLISRSDGKLKYFFICGEYSITPTGTAFRLTMSQGKLVVTVFSGGVVVSGADLRVKVPSGMMWDSADPGNIKSADIENIRDKKTGMTDNKPGSNENLVRNTGSENKIHDAEDSIRKGNEADPDEIRDLKRESREDIKDMKKESRKGRQFKGGN